MTAPKDALERALYEVETYGLGATSDKNQKVILGAAKGALATFQPSGEGREAIARLLMSFDLHSPWELTEQEKDVYFKRADRIILASGLVQNEAGWRDISTAPKDGTQILLWYPWALPPQAGAPDGFMYLAKWSFKEDGSEGWIDTSDDVEIGEGATHWMPAPVPPIRSARGGGASCDPKESAAAQSEDASRKKGE